MTTDAGWTIYIFNSDTSLFACELSCVRGELTQSYCTPLSLMRGELVCSLGLRVGVGV